MGRVTQQAEGEESKTWGYLAMHHSERKRGCWRKGGGRVRGRFAVLKEPSSSCGGLEGERRNTGSAGERERKAD